MEIKIMKEEDPTTEIGVERLLVIRNLPIRNWLGRVLLSDFAPVKTRCLRKLDFNEKARLSCLDQMDAKNLHHVRLVTSMRETTLPQRAVIIAKWKNSRWAGRDGFLACRDAEKLHPAPAT